MRLKAKCSKYAKGELRFNSKIAHFPGIRALMQAMTIATLLTRVCIFETAFETFVFSSYVTAMMYLALCEYA